MSTLTKPDRVAFTPTQRKVLFALASVVGLRMLGSSWFCRFLRFTVCNSQTPAFWSVSPSAAMSDHGHPANPYGPTFRSHGRRKVLLLGMTLFSLGSFLCATPTGFLTPCRLAL